MDPKKINLFVYDTKENFEKSKEFLGGFKNLICIEKLEDLDNYFNTSLFSDDEYAYMVIHVFAFDKLKGIRKFLTSGIPEKYLGLDYMYISDGAETKINHEMIDEKIPPRKVYKYHEVYSCLREGSFKVLTKKEIIQRSNNSPYLKAAISNDSTIAQGEYPKCDYAIITALEETEMEKVLPMLNKTESFPNKKHLIEYGHLKSNPKKTIVYASQLSTGMVDAAILATEIIVKFKPGFLILVGVLGGKPDEIDIGDVIVATRVFTKDKGKISDYGFQREIETSNTDNAYITRIKREKEKIITYIKELDITRDKRINIHFGSIACVGQVIDLEGFFKENITPVDRKAIALEMESYGISRACEIVNDGNTIALIIKSAMDNTKDKDDNAKPFAAWTSASVVKYILENDLI